MTVERLTDEVPDTSELLARRCRRAFWLSLVGVVAALAGCVSPPTKHDIAITSPLHVSKTMDQAAKTTATLPGQQPPVVEFASHIDPPPVDSSGELESLPDPAQPEANQFPIDLPTALHLAGANNLQIALASERVEQAYASINTADARWIPSLNLGVVYNQHDGQLQATEGNVSQISRSSLFVGGGVGLGGAPLPGGSSGPARMFVNLSLADVLFDPVGGTSSR